MLDPLIVRNLLCPLAENSLTGLICPPAHRIRFFAARCRDEIRATREGTMLLLPILSDTLKHSLNGNTRHDIRNEPRAAACPVRATKGTRKIACRRPLTLQVLAAFLPSPPAEGA